MAPEFPQRHQAAIPLQGPRFDKLVLEFATCAMSHAIEALGNLNRAMLFCAVARASGPFDPGERRAPPISINALAASLGRPFETTRRHTNALVGEGLLVRTAAGISMPLQMISTPVPALMIDKSHDLLVRLIEDCRAANLDLPTPRAGVTYDPRIGVGIAFDLMLATVEIHGQVEDNWTRLPIRLAIEWANQGYGGQPQHMSPVPIRPSALARLVGLPYATVARNVDILLAGGIVKRHPEGLVIPAHLLAAPATQETRIALANRARQLIGRAAQAGFPTDRPATAYIGRRPPLPALG